MLALPQVMWWSDVVWLVWNRSFLGGNIDFVLLRLSGANLVLMHCGDDVRCRHLQDAVFRQHAPGVTSGPYRRFQTLDLVCKLLFQWISERSGKVLTVRNQATFQFGQVGWFPIYQPASIAHLRSPNPIPVLVHAPSNRLVKRTDLVLEAVQILESEGIQFQFMLFEGVANSVVLEAIRSADIVIDQPATWPARFAIEGMAAGCVVVGGSNHIFMGLNPCPVIQFPFSGKDLADRLRPLISNAELRAKYMNESFVYWRQQYSDSAFERQFSDIIAGNYPRFSPLPDQKDLIILGARNAFQRWIIHLFYHPLP